MADTPNVYLDKMLYDADLYRPEVRLGNDGCYRWRYTYDSYHDRKMYRRLLKIFSLISLVGVAAGFLIAETKSVPVELLRQDPAQAGMLLSRNRLIYALLGYVICFTVFALITALIRLMEGGPSTNWFLMNEELVRVQPSGRASGINRFSDIKRVEILSDVNELRLISRLGKCSVLVRSEDFSLVKNFILAHLPKDTVIQEKEP